jgi:hypothetical protein
VAASLGIADDQRLDHRGQRVDELAVAGGRHQHRVWATQAWPPFISRRP